MVIVRDHSNFLVIVRICIFVVRVGNVKYGHISTSNRHSYVIVDISCTTLFSQNASIIGINFPGIDHFPININMHDLLHVFRKILSNVFFGRH